jgi:hypothetical protein
MTEPSLDVFASARLGHPMEALDGIAAEQPRAVGRWMLSPDALEYLWSIRTRGLVPGAKRKSPAGTALREAGLTNGLGALSDEGQQVAQLLERAEDRYAGTARHGGAEVRWGMWLRGDTALVRAEGTVADLVDGTLHPEVSSFDVLPAGRAVGHLLAWARVSPAWAFADDEGIVLPPGMLDARVQTAGVPEAGFPGAGSAGGTQASGSLAERLWSEPVWIRIRAWSETSAHGFDVVSAGAAGYFAPSSLPDGSTRLTPVPSGSVLRSAIGMFAR